jgi:hypothetical protein
MDDGQFLNITLSNTNPNKIMILSVVDSVAITTKTYQVQVNDEMGAYGSYAKGIDRSYISYSGELTIEKLNAEIIEGTLNMDFKSSDSESSISFEGTFTALSGYNVP